MRFVRGLVAPSQEHSVIFPGVVVEAVLAVHVENRLQSRQRGRVLAKSSHGDRHVELHDHHRMVVEHAAIEFDSPMRRRYRGPQFVVAIRLAPAFCARYV